jgi:hypothetical protein
MGAVGLAVLGGLIAAVSGLIGVYAGYLLRRREWLDQRRIESYGQFLDQAQILFRGKELSLSALEEARAEKNLEKRRAMVAAVMETTDQEIHGLVLFGQCYMRLILVASEPARAAATKLQEATTRLVMDLGPKASHDRLRADASQQIAAFVNMASLDLGRRPRLGQRRGHIKEAEEWERSIESDRSWEQLLNEVQGTADPEAPSDSKQ